VTVAELVTNAALDLGLIDPTESLSTADQSYLIAVLNRLLNAWNADRRAVYATAFADYTLTADLSPHTIGPTGATFTAVQRPVSIDGANLILDTSSPAVLTPIAIRDAQWWLGQSVQALSSDVPTDLYYQPDWPNGKLYFWPVPSAAYQVQLLTRVLLADTLTSGVTFTLPPGYELAVQLTLEEYAARGFGKPLPPELPRQASLARATIFANNDQIPRLETHDAGMTPGTGGRRADFNYLTGQIV
jgi:hypothetical protein